MSYQDYIENELIIIEFNKEMLEEFTGYSVESPQDYFKAHPRAKKPPMESLWGKTRKGLIPSLNKFLNVGSSKGKSKTNANLARVTQNQWEQHLKDYCMHCMLKQGIKHNYLDKCLILVVNYKPTASKSDNSNIYVKPFEDGMVEWELIQDDNYTIVQYHSQYSVVDKHNPRSEIVVFPIIDDYDFDTVMFYMTQYVVDIRQKYSK